MLTVRLPPKKARDTKGDRQQCASYLTEIGRFAFFAYAAIHPDLSRSRLLTWTQRLRDAIWSQRGKYRPKRLDWTGKPLLVTPRITNKMQVVNWLKASPLPTVKYEKPIGLDFRVMNVAVCGGLDASRWQGDLVLIYEATTDTLYHHFATSTRSRRLSAELLLFALGRAASQVDDKAQQHDAKRESASAHYHPKIVTFLTPAAADETSRVFGEAFSWFAVATKPVTTNQMSLLASSINQISAAYRPAHPERVQWRGEDVNVDFSAWSARQLHLAPGQLIELAFPTSVTFSNALIRLCDRLARQHDEDESPTRPNNFTWHAYNKFGSTRTTSEGKTRSRRAPAE